jgi:hypothetical protein
MAMGALNFKPNVDGYAVYNPAARGDISLA